MLKHLFIIINIITFACPLYAMKVELTNLPNSHIRWFQRLPLDIINLIGHFLLHNSNIIETKEEFINRSQYMIHKNSSLSRPNTGEMVFSAYCPNGDKCALLRISHKKAHSFHTNEQLPSFSILQTKNDISLYQENLPDKEYKCIAISQDGNMFATIHMEHEITNDYFDFCTVCPRYISILTIKNILSQKIKSFNIHQHFEDPFGFTLPALAFNKQGSLLIVHYHNNNNSSARHSTTPKNINEYKIFKNIHTSYRDTPQNLLDKYLAYRHVCKTLTHQIIQNN